MKKSRISKFYVIPIVGFLVLLLVVSFLQFSMTINNLQENARAKLILAQNRINSYDKEDEKDWESYDSFIQSKADMIALMIDTDTDAARQQSYLFELCDSWGLSELYIVDGENVISATDDALSQKTADKFRDGAAFDTEKSKSICYYSSKLSDGSMLIVGQESSYMLESEEYMTSINHALSDIKVGDSGYLVAYEHNSDGDAVLAYAPKDSVFCGDDAPKQIESLDDGYKGFFTLSSENFYVCISDTEDYRIMAVTPAFEIYKDVFRSVIIAASIFGCALLLFALYAKYLDKDIKDKLISPKMIKSKLKIVTCVSLICVFVLSMYTCFLSSVAETQQRLYDNLDDVESIINQNSDKTKQITNTYEEEYLKRAQRIAYLLNRCPQLINNDSLVELAKRGQLYSVNVFNGNGELDATSTVFNDYHISTDESSQSYEFWNIIKGYDDYIVHPLQRNETVKHDLVQYIGVKRLDKAGMIEIGVSPERLSDRLYGESIDDVLSNIAVEDNGTVTYEEVTEDTPESYFGFKNDNGVYLVSSRIIDGNNIIVSIPINAMLKTALIIALIITALCAAIMLLFSISTIKKNKELIDNPKDEPVKKENATNRLNTINTPWNKLTAGSKIARLVFIILVFLALIIIFGVKIFSSYENNIINFILSKKWDLGINLFSVSYIAFIAIEVIFFSTLLRKIILYISEKNGGRAETFGRLFNSLIKYAVVIGTAFYSLHFLGVDTTTLLASAGLLTLGVSLGAQSLVSDILAGLFIVFEGDFRVGDIVTIGDFRGTVREIGIRTTKIESPGNDMKIFRNSELSGVINMTKQYSYAAVDCGIEYSESIERVESILKKELPLVKERLPKIVDGPFYKGISELGDSSVVVKIVALCHEKDRIQLMRDLNREIKLIFDKHDVGIPFPQVVVNKPIKKIEATDEEKLDAKAFVEEQEELSKTIATGEED